MAKLFPKCPWPVHTSALSFSSAISAREVWTLNVSLSIWTGEKALGLRAHLSLWTGEPFSTAFHGGILPLPASIA